MGEGIDDENAAALRIQSVQRGRQARREVEHKKEEADAAKKIQAMQRGKAGRAKANDARQARGDVFVRPFEVETDETAVLKVNRNMFISHFQSFDALVEALQGEVPLKRIDGTLIYYSTEQDPSQFSNLVSAKKLEDHQACTSLELDYAKKKCDLKALQGTPVSATTAEGNPKTKSQLAAEEKAREKELKQGEHAVAMSCGGNTHGTTVKIPFFKSSKKAAARVQNPHAAAVGMEGSGEFAGAISASSDLRDTNVPDEIPELSVALKYIEKANTMANDLGKHAVFRAVGRSGRVYVRAEVLDAQPKSWTWVLFASVFRAIEKMWHDWMRHRKRGLTYEEPHRSQNVFHQPHRDMIGIVEFTLSAIRKPSTLRMTDLTFNVLGYITMQATPIDEEGTFKVEVTEATASLPAGTWGHLRTGKTSGHGDFTHIFVKTPEPPTEEEETVAYLEGASGSSEVYLEVWVQSGRRQSSSQGGGGAVKRNPLICGDPSRMGGGYSGEGGTRRTREDKNRMRCVVCSRTGRKGELRKSGFKCTECIGIPSSTAHKQSRPSSHQCVRPISTFVVGDPDIARQLLVPSLPGSDPS